MIRLGKPPEHSQTYTRRPGAYAVIQKAGSALITKDAKSDLTLPGGGIDPGENPITALHREVMEETGWRIAIDRRLGAYQRYCYMPEYDKWALKVCVIYLCRPILKISAPTEPQHTPIWSELHLLPGILDDETQGQFVAAQL